jgi:hypothetical protein
MSKRNCKVIPDRKMNWEETRKLLDKVASEIIQRFTDRIDEEGPEAIGEQLAFLDLEETAAFFYDLKFQDVTEYEEEPGKIKKFEGLSKVPEIKGFADWIKRKYELDLAEEDYEDFCTHVAKMLIHLKQMKLDLISELEKLENGVPEKQARLTSHDEKEG